MVNPNNAVVQNVRQKTHGTVHVKIRAMVRIFLNAATHGVSLKKAIDTLHQLS